MADLNARIKPKKSSTASEVPLASDLEVAEIAVNTADGRLFTKHTDNSIVEIGGGGATAIDDLTDVDTSTTPPTDGQVLTWDNANSQWEPANAPSGGATAIDDLTDVDTTTVAPSNGDILQYDGSNWVTGVGNSSIVDGGNWESGTSTGGGLLVDGGVIT